MELSRVKNVIMELRRVENGGYRTKNYVPNPNSTTVMKTSSILIELVQFRSILETLDPILGQIVTLCVWKRHTWTQLGWKWGYRTKKYVPIPNSTIVMTISSILIKLVQFWPTLEALDLILGQVITLHVWKRHNRTHRGAQNGGIEPKTMVLVPIIQ